VEEAESVPRAQKSERLKGCITVVDLRKYRITLL
jgi:hypothetical protein